MSRKGWQKITTPIGGQTVSSITVSSPAVNQLLVYNGTNWVNSNSTIGNTGLPIYLSIYNTAASSVNIVSNTTPVPLNNMSGTLTLNVGTYYYTAIANITGDVGSGGYGHLKLVKIGGTGTFTHAGQGYSIFVVDGGSASFGPVSVGTVYNDAGTIGIAISAIGSRLNSTNTSGTFTISTSSVTFDLEYKNDINTGTFTFDHGLIAQFIKIA